MPFIFDSFTVSKFFVISIGLLLISLKLLFDLEQSQVRNLPRIFTVLIAGFLITMALSWFQSGVPLIRGLFGQYGRGNGIFYYFFAMCIFVIAAKTFSSSTSHRTHKLMTYLAWFLSIYAILQRFGIDVAKLNTLGLSPVVLTFGNSNFAGGMLSFLFVYHFIFLILDKKFSLGRVTLTILLLLTSTLPAAVQGYLIIVFGLAIGTTILISQKYKKLWVNRSLLILWIFAVLNIILGVLGQSIFSRIFARESFRARIEYWKISIEIIKDNLIFGVGPDRLYDVTPNYLSPGSLKIITTTRMDNSHNWFLNLTANSGLVPLVFLVTLLGAVLYVIWRTNKNLIELNPNVFASGIAFIGVLIDALVSIEQPGIGIWLYLFAGIALGGYLESNTNNYSAGMSDSTLRRKSRAASHIIILVNVIFLLFSVVLVTNRIISDSILRTNVQSALVNKGTETTFSTIEEMALRLSAEPEYAVQALRPLAALGDIGKIDSVSNAYYSYYPLSIQANLIRADVLRALNREKEACAIRSLLLRNTPWDSDQLEKYVICQVSGQVDPELDSIIKLVHIYFEPIIDSPIDLGASIIGLSDYHKQFVKLSERAWVYNVLGFDTQAKQYKTRAIQLLGGIIQIEKSIGTPEVQLDKASYLKMLNF
jgi:O-antigen ligase